MLLTSDNQSSLLGDESVRGTERRCGDLWSRCFHNFCLFDVDNCGQDVNTLFVCLMLTNVVTTVWSRCCHNFVCLMLTNVVKMLALISFPLMYDGVHFVRILTMIQ